MNGVIKFPGTNIQFRNNVPLDTPKLFIQLRTTFFPKKSRYNVWFTFLNSQKKTVSNFRFQISMVYSPSNSQFIFADNLKLFPQFLFCFADFSIDMFTLKTVTKKVKEISENFRFK